MVAMQRLYSIVFWAFLGACSIAMFPVAVLCWAVTAPFDKRKYVLHRLTCFWGSLYTWLNPAWPVSITGLEKIDEDEAAVMVANHLSLLDILVLFRLFSHFKWVSKVENFRVPFIGWNMSLNGYIPVKRGNRQSVVEMMRSCERTLATGSPIMMFPEGTRSSTGRMRSWKPGAFQIAERNGVAIQPIVLRGTSEALPKRGFILQGRHAISIEVLDSIPAEQVANKTPEEMTQHVRAILVDALKNDVGTN